MKKLNRRNYKWWHKLILAISATVIFLLILEGVSTIIVNLGAFPSLITKEFRINKYTMMDFDTIFYNRPNSDYYRNMDFGVTNHYKTNSQGYRDEEELRPDKPNDEIRILCIGDSSTYGLNVDQDQTFPAQLQGILNQRRWEGSYKVINAGCPGFSSFQAMRLLETRGRSTQPDIIILSVGVNDSGTVRQSDVENDYHNAPLPFLRRMFFQTNSYYFLSNLIGQIRLQMPGYRNKKQFRPRVFEYEFESNLRTCIKIAQSLKARMIFCSISVPINYLEAMKRVAEEEGITMVNAEDALFRILPLIGGSISEYGGQKMRKLTQLEDPRGSVYGYCEKSIAIRQDNRLMDDFIHPNPIGYRAIAEDISVLIP